MHHSHNQGITTHMQNLTSTGKKALAALGLIILAYMVLDMNHRVAELVRITAERDMMATSVFEVKETQAFLESEIAFANSDAAVEAWAREDAFMARPGEHPVIMLPDPNFTPVPTPIPVAEKVVLENWQIWGELFFGR